ncbi:cytochrome C [Ottowia sp. GY511]|nr:diheme cytochrome c [Ottowia sp. GY511]TXK24739.1 cytochrome C [Ottowia sp. GY511]
MALMGAALWPAAAHADDHRRLAVPLPRAYVQECAGCHMAYPPGLLPAASWRRMMGRLDEHYGSDASIDEATVRQLSEWLQTHAGTSKRVRAEPPPPDDRITRSEWFARKHDEIAPATWRRASIRSAANCMACHPGAERSDFDDDAVRVPK